MLFIKPDSILSYTKDREFLLRLVEAIAVRRLEIAPVFECVKTWCKLDKDGILLFARTKEHVLSGGVSPTDVVSQFKNENVKAEAYDILCTICECLPLRWPFFDGSSAWVLLEILSPVFAQKTGMNERTVILRESSRLSYIRGPVKSPMSEKVFKRMEKRFVYKEIQFTQRPSSFLESSSGDGFLTEMNQKAELTKSDVDGFVQNIVKRNHDVVSSFGFPRGGIRTESMYIVALDILFGGKLIRVPVLPRKKNDCDSGMKVLSGDPIWRG